MLSDENTQKIIKIENNDIVVWTYGKEQNHPIIFIHGYFRGFSDYFGDLPPRHLLKNYYIIAFDLPGFGKSKNISMDKVEFIKQVESILLPNKKFTIFGLSYGGLLALKYAEKYPQRLTSIIVAGTPFFPIYLVLNFLSRFPFTNNLKLLLADFAFLNSRNIKKIKTPTLLYYSSKDYLAHSYFGKKLDMNLPNSRIIEINKYNHQWLLHGIDKTGFLNEIEKFLSK